MLFPLLLCCALPGVLPAAGPPLPPALPETVLAAPVNLTWAANHAADFRRRGFSGFVVHGVAGDLPADAARAADRLAHDGLRREIRAAANRLRDAGLPNNFLALALAPDEAWFADPNLADAAVARFAAAGAFCKAAGLAGIAFDTHTDSPIHHPRWDGYPLDPRGAARVREGARRLASRALRAFIREMPEADILVVVDDLEAAGPLWFAFFAGLIEAPGAADTVRLHVVPRAAARRAEPRAIARARGEIQVWIDDRLPPETARRWRDTGRVALAVAPLGYAGDAPVAWLPTDLARIQHAAALLASDRFVWVDAPRGGWWSVPPEDAVRYAHLLQDGPAAVGAVLPLHPLWARYDCASPLAGLDRVGPWPDAPGAIDVLAGPRGAAALFWDGIDAPLALPNRFASALVTDLATSETVELFPSGGRIEVPASGTPTLIDGLPHGDWTVPAALWIAPDALPDTAARGVRLRYGWRNATGQPIAGALGLETPPRYGAGAALQALNLAPGEGADHAGHVIGRLRLDDPVELRVSLTLPADRIVGREIALPVAPATRWSVAMDGPMALGAPVPYIDAAGRPRVAAGSAGGDLRVVDADGAPVWIRQGRDPLAAPPAVLLRGPALPAILAADTRGRLRLHHEPDGATLWERTLPAPPAPGGIVTGDLFGTPYDGVLVATTDGRLHCLLPNGETFWIRDLPGPAWIARFDPARIGGTVPDHAAERAVGQRLYMAVAAGADSALVRMDPMGNPQWRRPLPAPPSAPPLVYPIPAGIPFATAAASHTAADARPPEPSGAGTEPDDAQDSLPKKPTQNNKNINKKTQGDVEIVRMMTNEDEFAIAIGLADGTVLRWHAHHGMPLGRWSPPDPAPIAELRAAPWEGVDGLALIVAGPGGVWILDGALEPIRHYPVPGAMATLPCRVGGEDLLLIADATGTLHAHAVDGPARWRADLGLATPLAAWPAPVAARQSDPRGLVFGTSTGLVRAIDLGAPRRTAPPAAPRETGN